MAPIRKYKDFDVWKLAVQCKRTVFRLLRGSRGAAEDPSFRKQLIKSARGPASHIAEGYLRKSPRTFALYLKFGIASIGESEEHLDDGVELGYFDLEPVLALKQLGKRCTDGMSRLRDTQLRDAEEQEAAARSRRQRGRPTPQAPRRNRNTRPREETDDGPQ